MCNRGELAKFSFKAMTKRVSQRLSSLFSLKTCRLPQVSFWKGAVQKSDISKERHNERATLRKSDKSKTVSKELQ